MKRILSIDMGSSNCAWAVLKKGKPIAVGTIQKPISSLAFKVQKAQRLFKNEIKEIMDKYITKKDIVVAERFQIRSFNPGAEIELIGVMLGIISAQSPCQTHFILPATWKNHMLRTYGENVMEHVFLKEWLADKWTEHEADAIGMGLWYYETELEKPNTWLNKYFPLPESCKTCWASLVGCNGKELCDEYSRIDKKLKCKKCVHSDDCEAAVQEDYGSKKATTFNRNTYGCTEYEKEK